MRSLLAIVTLVACSEAWAQVTLPHDLQPNTKASASKVMENFRALESAIEGIGGCTATQQDNSVLIECADGSSGVLAGAGTVLIYPEGQVGEVPPVDLNTNPITIVDGAGQYLAPLEEISESDGSTVIEVMTLVSRGEDLSGTYEAFFFNHAGTQTVHVLPEEYAPFSGAKVGYLEDNCEGQGYLVSDYGVATRFYHFENEFKAYSDQGAGPVIFRSFRYTDQWDRTTAQWVVSDCTSDISTGSGIVLATFTLPASWDNIVYPVSISQEP